MNMQLYDQDAEIASLGSVIIDSHTINKLGNILKPEDFYITKHQKIFRTMLDMQSKDIPIDILTLRNELSSKGILEDIGGSYYLTYLHELTPTTANTEYYAKMIKELSRLRTISEFIQKTQQDINERKTNFNEARNYIGDFHNNISKEDCNSEIIKLCHEPDPQDRKWIMEDFIPMGFPTTLYSTGGVGKSYLAISLSLKVCIGGNTFLDKAFPKEPINTLYLDFELDKTEITRRTLEVISGMGLNSIPENFYYKSPESNISVCLRELPTFIKNQEIGFIVIDSMGAAGLDSMDEKTVIDVYSRLRELGLTTLVIDHQSKLQSKDSPENKSPFGSVYKYNMSRSVIHLVYEKSIENGFTVKLVHKKSNFGKLCEEELLDIIFDENDVRILESDSITQNEEEMLIIKDGIIDMLEEQEYVKQKDIIQYFKNTLSKNRIINLLKTGESKHWYKEKAKTKNTFLYIPISEQENVKFQKSAYIYNRNSGFLKTDLLDEIDSLQ